MISVMEPLSLLRPANTTPQTRLRILVLAYSISPVRGSEYSVGWNFVRYMAERCDLTVLYGLAGPHMGDGEEIETFLAETDDLPNVTFEKILPNTLARTLNLPNRKGYLVYSFYLAYRVWHWQAAQRARRILQEQKIDLIHYLCPIGYREPGYLWQINRPYVWGPVGGMVATRTLPGAPRSWKSRLKVRLKNLINAVQLRTSTRLPKAIRRADVVIAATSENQRIMRARFGVEALLVAENAIPDEWLDTPRCTSTGTAADVAVQLIWIGSMDLRKSPDLLIDALSRVTAGNWHLDVIGGGPLWSMAEAMAQDRGLAGKVSFHGQIPRHDVQGLLSRADLHLITSMSEGNPTTIWEAMAVGVPTVSLDHNGMHDVLCDSCGVRVPLGSYDATCDAFAGSLDLLLGDTLRLESLKEGTRVCRDQFRWSRRTEDWMSIYRTAHERHGKD